MEKLQNKRVLIVGATGTIGSIVSEMLHESGAELFLSSTDSVKLAELQERLSIPAENCFECSLAHSADIVKMAESIHAQIPGVDILINAAGIGILKPLEQLTEEEFERSIQINLTGSFRLLKAFLPAMKTTGKGLIIHLPGVLSKVPMSGAAAYSASKYGLEGLLKSVREELKRTEIRITNVILGGVDTAFWDQIDMRVQRDKFIQAKEAARAIWFLCQQPSSGVVSEMVIQPFNHQAI